MNQWILSHLGNRRQDSIFIDNIIYVKYISIYADITKND